MKRDALPPPGKPSNSAQAVTDLLARNQLPVEALDLFALLRHVDALGSGAKLGYSFR